MCCVVADGRFQEDILQECELGLVAGPACADRCSVVQSRNIISDNYPHNARVTAHVSRVYMHTYHCTRVTIHTCHYAHVSALAGSAGRGSHLAISGSPRLFVAAPLLFGPI